MNCLKSVRFVRDFGTVRLAMVSISAIPVFFVLFETLFLNIHPNLQLNPFRLSGFLISLLIVYPLHKLFHCLPVWACGKKAALALEGSGKRIPLLHCHIKSPVSRNIMMVCVSFPLIMISGLLLAAAILIPSFLHYYAISGALNFGLSMTDCLYISFLLKAPANAFVEDDRDGFHILVQTYKTH